MADRLFWRTARRFAFATLGPLFMGGIVLAVIGGGIAGIGLLVPFLLRTHPVAARVLFSVVIGAVVLLFAGFIIAEVWNSTAQLWRECRARESEREPPR